MTRFWKGRDGWAGKTTIPLDDGSAREVQISTWKGQRGGVSTSVTVHTREGAFVSHKLFSDYSKRWALDDVRVTEKAVTTQHNRVLALKADILADVAEFYAKRVAA
jgi:hypothetical protein